MRRSDRAVQDQQQILEIVQNCTVCRIALNTGQAPYIVPLNFGFEMTDEGALNLYFHSALDGRKLDLLKADSRVGFEMDTSLNLIPANTACDYAMEFESIVGLGELMICDSEDEKQYGLSLIMRHYAPNERFEFVPKMLNATTVLKLCVHDYEAKRLRKKGNA